MADTNPELLPPLAQPDVKDALCVGTQVLDYATLSTACASYRRTLAEAGLTPGDRVAVWAHPTLATSVAIVGNMLAGLCTIPLNPSLGRRELEHVLADAEPDAIFSAYADEDSHRSPSIPVFPIRMAEGSMVIPRFEHPSAEDAPLLILYTSGTTGAPKGVPLTLRNLCANLDALTDAWNLTADDHVVHALPLFHAHGLVLGLLGVLRVGATLHWFPRFRPAQVAQALRETGGVMFGVPTMYRRMADAAQDDPEIADGLRAARLLVSGSAALPVREHERLEALSGQRVVERYGLTETLINTSIRHDGERRAGTVGQPLKGVELRLVDDQRTPVDARDDTTIGEVAVRGPNVFKGYLNNAEATAKVLDDEGWFYTGDLATRAADGYARIVGRRATDLIKTGGFKVGAGEVEGALLEHPSVDEAAVIGVEDDDLGQRIVAFVVPRDPGSPPPPEALETHVAELLARHKRPREVRFVEDLPRNAMGKVQKPRLHDLLEPG